MASKTKGVKKSPGMMILWGALTVILMVAVIAAAFLFLREGEQSVAISPREVTLEVGQTQQLELVSASGEKLSLSAQWYSEHPMVASVNSEGLVTAAAPGETRVNAVVTLNGSEVAVSAVIRVTGAPGSQDDKVEIQGDETTELLRDDSGLFIVDSASAGVIPDTKAGTIKLQNTVSNTEFFFAAKADEACADAWEVRGTITKENMKDTLFFSFGVKDTEGKEQWFCILEEYISLQRYWDWWSNSYAIDNVHVGYNQPATSFFWRETGGNNLDFILVLKDDVLKLYFGNDSQKPELAWSLPLTEETFGGFAEGSEYQIGLNSVDPANVTISGVTAKVGDSVEDLGGVVGGRYADIRYLGDRFHVLSAGRGVSFNATKGTITINPTAEYTETWFYTGQEDQYSETWEMNGTATKKNIKDALYLSFGVRDESGNEQWFCIFENTMAQQRICNWNDSRHPIDGTHVIFNQPACSFYWREAHNGGKKLDYKLIITDDVLYAYYGNDQYDMSLAWSLPLTDPQYGGFAPGSSYQLGMTTVETLQMNFTDVLVRTGEEASVVPEYVEGGKFILQSKSPNVQADPVAGELTVDKSQDKTQIIFAAEPNSLTSTAWEMSGTIRKELADTVFLSFGVIDAAGKDQWFCILDDCMALQRYWNWWDTKYPADGEHVVTNMAASNFFYKNTDNLNYKIIVKDDVLYAYFGNDLRELQLAWCLPLTEETFGGFAAGSRYKLAINIVDPNNATISDVNVTVGDEVQAPDLEAEKDTSKYKFFVDSYTGDLLAKPIEGRINLYGTGNTQTIFAADAQNSFARKWELSGTVTKNNKEDNLFMSFGVRDTEGRNQWICIYNPNKGVSLRPTWDWSTDVYLNDDKYIIYNETENKFYWHEIDTMDFKVVLENDILKVYFGQDGELQLAWDVPLTSETFGGFAAGSAYQLAINTVDPCIMQFTDMEAKTEDIVAAPENIWDWYSADTAKTRALSYAAEGKDGSTTLVIGDSFFDIAFWDKFYSDFAGKDALIAGIGGSTAEDWINYMKFDLFLNGIAPKNVVINIGNNDIFNDGLTGEEAVENFKTLAETIHEKMPDAKLYQFSITARSGSYINDTSRANMEAANAAMSQWCAGQDYITFVDISDEMTADTLYDNIHPKDEYYTSVFVPALLEAGCELEERGPNRFEVSSASASIIANRAVGTLSYSGAEAKTEMFFAANATETHAKNWTMTGTIEKPDGRRIFISFGIKDASGKDQWFCIYEDTVALQRYWNWANSKQSDNRVNVIYNQASCSFSWSEQAVGGGKLHYKLVLEGDVLKVYFGNDIHPMALAWNFPLTDAKYGGFTAGSSYQVGITSVDAVPFKVTNLDVVTSNDAPQGPGEPKFYVSSKNERVATDAPNGTVMGYHNGNTEIYFAAGADATYAKNWQFSGTVTKAALNKSMFVSFGVKDSTGKDKWFCIYNDTVALQRYWNWADTRQPVDGVNVVTNADAENFFHRRLQALDFKLVLEGDVLKVYFGSNGNLTLAWTLDLTEELYGGFAPGSSYQLAFNTVDPCAYVISDINASTNNTDVDVARTITYEGVEGVTHTNPATYLYSNAAEITLADPSEKPGYTFDGWYIGETKITTLAGQTGKLTVTAKWLKNVFETADASDSITVNKAAGTLSYSGEESTSRTDLAASATRTHAKNWTMTGTITKKNVSDALVVAFGVTDANGKEQWFSVYKESFATLATGGDAAKHPNDGVISLFHQASCSFYWKETNQGAQKLDYKVVLEGDVLKVSFGNDKHPMYQAWDIPLTDSRFGGFAAGSEYQLSIFSANPTAFTVSNITVKAGYETPANRFELSSLGSGVMADKTSGTLSYMGVDRSEVIFAASAQEATAKNWELSGSIKKNDKSKNLFLSFGVIDAAGKDQWFCILDDCMALQRYWNWWDTKQPADGVSVITNTDAKDFFFKGRQDLDFRLVLEGDLLQVYFGSNGSLSLAWELPLTEELYGGFAIGSSYQLAINTVDACPMQISNITAVTGNEQILHERTITYEGVEDVTHTNPATYITAEAAGVTLSDPTAKPGYTFDGWYIDETKVTTLAGQTRDITVTAKWLKHKFEVASATSSITADNLAGTLTYSGAEAKTEMFFAANATETHAKNWTMTGTIEKPDGRRIFISFGIKDASGKDQWFCIYEDTVALQRYWNWANSKQSDNRDNVIYNQASCSFSWSEQSVGGGKLRYKLVIDGDVLKVYFGNDIHPLALAWNFPLTDAKYGGFTAGSSYQVGITSVDAVPFTVTGLNVVTNNGPAQGSGTPKFYVSSKNERVAVDAPNGTVMGNHNGNTEIYFAAGADATYAKNWQFSGTVTKAALDKSMFVSFGVKDSTGKDQWFCILDESMALQRYWNWWESKQEVDGVNVINNADAEDFFFKRQQALDFKLVLEGDVLKVYFGSNGSLSLAWTLDLTEELYGGFAEGSSYQLAFNTVDPCAYVISEIKVSTHD